MVLLRSPHRLYPEVTVFRRLQKHLCENANMTHTVRVNVGLARTLGTPTNECALIAVVEGARASAHVMLREKLGSSRGKRLNYFIMFNCIHATMCRLHNSFQSFTDEICEFLRQKLASDELIANELPWTGNGF